MTILRKSRAIIATLAACLALAACEANVDVNATATAPAGYYSVLVTIEEVWFHESAEAASTDEGWEKFDLKDTVTIDLVSLNNGGLARIADDLEMPGGDYRQMRILLADTHGRLRDSADDWDADYNNEVIWFDDDGDDHTSPLEVLNPAAGIGIEVDFDFIEATITSSTTTTRRNTVVLAFDAARDLTGFRYGGRTGFLLNPTLRAYDTDEVGTIRGTLSLAQLDIDTDTGRPEVLVTAQRLDRSLGRRVIVASAAVSRTGSFVLYPLPIDEDERTTEYDLVIHGPQIRTVIIRDVPVTEAAPGSTQALALGTLALEQTPSYEANISAESPLLPRGARVGFYQTLPGDDEPYLVGLATVDPLSGRMVRPVELSRSSTVSYGTYGRNFSLRAATPRQGEARYAVAAWSPHYGHGEFAETLLRPEGSSVAQFSVPAVGVSAPAVAGNVSTTLTVENPAVYDRGVLMVTREGALVTLAPLDEVLEQQLGSTFVEIDQVPAGSTAATFARGLYHLEAWTWHSGNPASTFRQHRGDAAVDLRDTGMAAGAVTIR